MHSPGYVVEGVLEWNRIWGQEPIARGANMTHKFLNCLSKRGYIMIRCFLQRSFIVFLRFSLLLGVIIILVVGMRVVKNDCSSSSSMRTSLVAGRISLVPRVFSFSENETLGKRLFVITINRITIQLS